ncbi:MULTISPECIES: transcriptional regulator [Metallosphaera]|uniref:transcriptional regulator n=1 Tax=Bacteria TaxID=2 RepID=UPI002989E812|nr:transcriptional regulator [Metallosphaera sedula]MCP6729953.1 transcriptional regulator [Metallosphaera sedula]
MKEKRYYNANQIRAEQTRKKILDLLAENYVLSASLISHTLLVSYATVLRHLRVLSDRGYIELSKEGRELRARIKQNVKEIQILNSQSRPFINMQKEPLLTKNENTKNKTG